MLLTTTQMVRALLCNIFPNIHWTFDMLLFRNTNLGMIFQWLRPCHLWLPLMCHAVRNTWAILWRFQSPETSRISSGKWWINPSQMGIRICINFPLTYSICWIMVHFWLLDTWWQSYILSLLDNLLIVTHEMKNFSDKTLHRFRFYTHHSALCALYNEL